MRCGLAEIYRMGWGDAVTDFNRPSQLSNVGVVQWTVDRRPPVLNKPAARVPQSRCGGPAL